MNKISTFKLTSIAIVLSLYGGHVLAAPTTAPKKILCWKDEHGARMCGDSIPTQYTKQEVDGVNKMGITQVVREKQKTEEEYKAIELAQKQKEDQEALDKKQKEYDNMLITTYSNVTEITSKKTEALNFYDKLIENLQKAKTAYKDERDYKARNPIRKPMPVAVDKKKKDDKNNKPKMDAVEQPKTYQQYQDGLDSSIAQAQFHKRQTLERIDSDSKRYAELKGIKLPDPVNTPNPATTDQTKPVDNSTAKPTTDVNTIPKISVGTPPKK